MSAYQKFILESGSKQQQHRNYNHLNNQQQQQQQHQQKQQQQQNYLQELQQKQIQYNQMNEFPPITMIKQRFKIPLKLPTVNSTSVPSPTGRHHYQRLQEAEHYATIQQEMQKNYNMKCQQNRQTLQQQQQLCNCRNHQTGPASYIEHQQQQQQQYQHQHQYQYLQQQQQQQQQSLKKPIESVIQTEDPILMEWLRAMRYETELECLTSLQARTLAIDEFSASALSIRNSQVTIQEMRLESNFILDYIDYLIELLPLSFNKIGRFSIEFSEIWRRLINQTAAQTSNSTQNTIVSSNVVQNSTTLNTNNNLYNKNGHNNHLTIINCTPRKSVANVRALRPLDKLAVQIRNLCFNFANFLYDYQENNNSINNNLPPEQQLAIDNGEIESVLRKLKELYGKFVEISIRAECANIIRALDQQDFSQVSLNRLSSASSLVHPVIPFESSSSQLPLKWALIALWQLTKDDSYICRILTEKWQATNSNQSLSTTQQQQQQRVNCVAKKLDYSTKYDHDTIPKSVSSATSSDDQNSLRSDYQKLYQICQREHGDKLLASSVVNNDENKATGALSNALQNKQSRQQQQSTRQVSTIELLIDFIISQPNKHERLDMMNFIHNHAQNNKLIDLEEWDRSISSAIYTSNQYKVAALRILNHLCVNEQAIKTILKCFSTPPPKQGHPLPENKIIRSIFECYQTSQEHIYENDIVFRANSNNYAQRGRKRSRKIQLLEDDDDEQDYSDCRSLEYPTNCLPTPISHQGSREDESDDVVVKEAIRLLVQLTTPFRQINQGLDFYNLMGRFSSDSIVRYLTKIIKSSTSPEMILLSQTVLANIYSVTTANKSSLGSIL